MSSLDEHPAQRTYWRSLAERGGTPDFGQCREPESPPGGEPWLFTGKGGGLSRRRWMELMGASLALAGLPGCRWQRRELLPAARQTSDVPPGQAQHFATTMELAGAALGLMVTCVDGRPIKIEGNPKDPASRGATHVYAQAAVLGLYDPDRSQSVYCRQGAQQLARTWEDFSEFARAHFAGLRKTGGEGFRVLSEASSSPTLAALRSRLLSAFPKATWHQYEPASWEEGETRMHCALDKAEIVVCLDADLFGTHPMAVRYARDFAHRRDPDRGTMSRLYVVESSPTITGVLADHRLPLRSGLVRDFVCRLYTEARRGPSDEAVATLGPQKEGPDVVGRFLHAMLDDLRRHAGKCVVVAGPGHRAVSDYVAALNAWFGTMGETVWYAPAVEPEEARGVRPLGDLVAAMRSGKVETLLLLGGNPGHNGPVDFEFPKALEQVATSLHLSLYRDETSRFCTWHLPQTHFLESWGDARGFDGLYRVIQPTIEPLYGGKSAIEVVAVVLGEPGASGQDLVKAEFRRRFKASDPEALWRRTVHDGLLAEDRTASKGMADNHKRVLPEIPKGEETRELQGLEIVFRPDPRVFDGRFTNNAWLQELPDPLTKLTWDNAALVSPATAQELGVASGEVVVLRYGGRELRLPAFVLPGQADGSVAVSLGYGRTAAGKVGGSTEDGIPPVGVNTYLLRTSRAPHFDAGLEVEPTGIRSALTTTQDHFAVDTVGVKARQERVGDLVRQTTLARYTDPKTPYVAAEATEHRPLESLWQEPTLGPPRWSMAIDLSKCTGCGACVVACQAENNIPVVGKEQVLRHREMHWIRIDRYFRGEPGDPQVVVQPVPCMHCELAPCEQVCPVAATVHSREGLNDMVYNRCVGTRYCSNNCPYKVRRFNFFNYHKPLEDPEQEVLKMAHNPQVTVRSRGVMEKCTYCVQRIQAAKIEAKSGGDAAIPDGTIRTACQQACPTGAILFGDLADPQSAVSAARRSRRTYGMLAELNVKPRTVYLARVRNPNPALPDGTPT